MDRAEAEKKRMLKEKTASTPAIAATPLPEETKHHQTPQTQIPAPSDEKPSAALHAEQESPQASKDPQESKDVAPATEQAIPTEAQKDVPQLSIEVSRYHSLTLEATSSRSVTVSRPRDSPTSLHSNGR